MRLEIHLQREIVRLHCYDPKLHTVEISRITGVCEQSVRRLRKSASKCDLSWDALSALDDDAWQLVLGTHDKSVAAQKLPPDWNWVHTEMGHKDATLHEIWRGWKQTCPDGIGYSRFTEIYREWCNKNHLVLRKAHAPGEKLFVDFAGGTKLIRSRDGSPPVAAHIFVACMGYSGETFVYAVPSQSTDDWLRCHVACFEMLGAVPRWVVMDNLKAAVWRREKGRIVMNPAYVECLRHYGTAALPTGVRKPKHKAKVENTVRLVQRWILFRLKDREYFDLADLNADLALLTADLNQRSLQKLDTSREERYRAHDLPAMRPLPARPFEICDWRRGVLIPADYHVEHDRCFYSVPYKLRMHRVDIRFTQSAIEILEKNRRVALHARLSEPGLSGIPWCARRSWRGLAGGRPAWVRGSARPVVSVAQWKVTTTAKRTQRCCGVWD